ncbi:MAG TPA: hypothetical protein VHX59_01630 [Mycobacteriales bacterium]|jgi:hypothetical protein|nr:hypothetical protein [Mycobacteriales bacterium]
MGVEASLKNRSATPGHHAFTARLRHLDLCGVCLVRSFPATASGAVARFDPLLPDTAIAGSRRLVDTLPLPPIEVRFTRSDPGLPPIRVRFARPTPACRRVESASIGG